MIYMSFLTRHPAAATGLGKGVGEAHTGLLTIRLGNQKSAEMFSILSNMRPSPGADTNLAKLRTGKYCLNLLSDAAHPRQCYKHHKLTLQSLLLQSCTLLAAIGAKTGHWQQQA